MRKNKKSVKRLVSMFLTTILVVSTMLPAGLSHKAHAQISEQVVISQVYGGGGNSGATFKNDFIELYNPTDQDINLEGWSVQYGAKGSAVSDKNITPLSGAIKAHSFYLIQQAKGSGGTTELPKPDAVGNIALAAGEGKVALVNSTNVISGAKDLAVVDFVGFGGANEFEGTGPTATLSAKTSAQRIPYAYMVPGELGNGWDTNDNALDFIATTPVPHNSTISQEFNLTASLPPLGNQMLFMKTQEGYKLFGEDGSVLPESTLNIYGSSNPDEALLATTTATVLGGFNVTFNSETELNSIFVTATQDKAESIPVEINQAVVTASMDATAMSYNVDNEGKGTLIGNANAAADGAEVYVFSDSEKVNWLQNQQGSVQANAKGEFTYVITTDAPETIYIAQKTSSYHGLNHLSETVSVEKVDTSVVTPIAEMRASDENGHAINLNDYFTIEGVVIVDNGILGSQKSNFYIQDGTAGINIYGNSLDHQLAIKSGDKLRVTGKVLEYKGLTEFEPTKIKVIAAAQELPAVKEVSILDMNTYEKIEPLEGSLAKVSGKVSAVSALSGGGYNVTLLDENTKATTIRIMEKTNIDINTAVVSGKSYTFTGVLSQYSTSANPKNGYQLFPRNVSDITSVFDMTHEAITTAYKNADVSFEAFADAADSLKLFVKAAGADSFAEYVMTGDGNGRYTYTLKAADVPQEGFEYYIKATSGDKTKETIIQTVNLISDEVGPTLSGEKPQNNTRVETPRPEISVFMEDPSGVNVDSVEIFLDNEKLTTATITSAQVNYTPVSDLTETIHTVKVVAKDTKGNESTKEWTFEIVPRFTGGKHYRGTTHNHTNISHDGTGSPEEALKAGQKYGYDYFAFSDHSHDIDADKLGTDTVDRQGMPERSGGSDWQLTKDLADQYSKDGEYVVFPAFEMTSTTWGHSNVFGTENFIDRNINGKQYQNLDQYYAWVISYEDVVAQFNHPDMSTNAFNSFKPYDQKVDQLFTMLEVGNGSGNYAYANAEKKYFSTLDLGWHLAPTYGEDNHDGTWGKTNARTVIVADDLTQASLLHSMRNMRVYMSEDANANLDVMANGYYMGSTVDSTTLDFEISVEDLVAESKSNGYDYLPNSYSSNDVVEKVEIITNGGRVVETHTPTTKDVTWKPTITVPSGQQWFVVRVTQKDGERIYSAPIWSKEVSVDVKVNAVDVTGDVIIEGNPAKLNATVGNFGTQEVKNFTVDFYLDEAKESNKIGTSSIASILSKGTGTASVTWATPTKGNHNIIAVVTSNDGLEIGNVSFTLPVLVKEPLGIKVLIDAAHGNENSSSDGGSYKDNLKAFTLLLQKEGYTVAENKAEISDATFTGVNVFMLTHPKTVLTPSEQTAVAKFVQNGGSLLVAGKSNNSTDPTINNTLLAEAGSTIRIQSDGVFDLSKTGNFWSDPAVSPFAVRPHPGLVDNYLTDRVPFVDYYSGASLAGADNTALTDNEKVTILVKGNETTYQGNLKSNAYAYDTVSDNEGGSKIPLIASEEIGEKGRIIVSGMNIFNDKQLDEAYEPKGNDEFSLNAINWLAHRETKVTPIKEARKVINENEIVVEGTVTAEAGVFFDAFYIQDETGGIMAFQEVPADSLKLGDKVRIYGHIISFDNNIEIEFTTFERDVIKIGSGEVIQPKVVTTGEATSSENQGSLVKVKGEVKSIYDSNSYIVNDGSGDVLVFTDGYIAIQSGPVPTLKVGDMLEAVGLSGEFAGGPRIRVRNTKELMGTPKVVVNPPTEPAQTNPGQVTADGTAVSNQANDPATTEVKVAVPALSDAQPEVSAKVPTASFQTIAQSSKPLVIASGKTEVVVPNEVLKKIAAGNPESVTISVKMAKSTDVNGAVSAKFEFTITTAKNGSTTKVSTFSTPVEVTVPVSATEIKDPRKVAAYYMNETKKGLEYVGGAYGNGQVVFKTNHFSKFVVVENNKTFQDIQKHWAQDQIEVLASRSITSGKTETSFDSEGKVTRAEFAVLIARALNLPIEEYQGKFKDVPTSKAWAYGPIEAAQRAGIVYGKTVSTFEPDALITREEMAAIIVRAIKYQDDSLLENVDSSKTFADNREIGSFARDAVNQAVGMGIFFGRSGNKFDPKTTATRAETAVILYRALDKLNEF